MEIDIKQEHHFYIHDSSETFDGALRSASRRLEKFLGDRPGTLKVSSSTTTLPNAYNYMDVAFHFIWIPE